MSRPGSCYILIQADVNHDRGQASATVAALRLNEVHYSKNRKLSCTTVRSFREMFGDLVSVLSLRNRVAWPPALEKSKVLGYITDSKLAETLRRQPLMTLHKGQRRRLPANYRPICQSRNKVYYVFGDTFCQNAKGGYAGLSCNTIAEVPDVQAPTLCRCQRVTELGFVAEFVPFATEEMRFNKEHSVDSRRIALRRVT